MYQASPGLPAIAELLVASGEVRDQRDPWTRCVVIRYNNNNRQFVFSARRWHSTVSSYICQLQQQGMTVMVSRCIEVYCLEWSS